MDRVKIEVRDGLDKMFVLYNFHSNDSRISNLRDFHARHNLSANDAGVVYDLLRVSEEWFTFKYYQRYTDERGRERWEYQYERNDDFDEARWLLFEQKRQAFLDAYFRDIDFDNKFFMAREIRVGGFNLPIDPDVLMVGGFDRWWIGPTRDNSAEDGFSDALYIPENPTTDTLANFVEENGMSMWKILDETFARDATGLWSFLFSKESIFNMNSAGFFTDSRRALVKGIEDRYLNHLTLISKMTAHLAGLWDLARIIRYFKKKNNSKLETAFRGLYEGRVDKLMRAMSGEDLLSLLAVSPQLGEDQISPVGNIPGYEDEDADNKEKVDPREKRLTKNLDFVDLAALFADPKHIQYLLEDAVGTEIATISSFVNEFSRVEYSDEEDLERTILDVAYLPLKSIEE